MNELNQNNLIEFYEKLDEDKLIQALLMNPEDYEDQVYNIILNACKNRGLEQKLLEEKTRLNIENQKIISKQKAQKENELIQENLTNILCLSCNTENHSGIYYCVNCGKELSSGSSFNPYPQIEKHSELYNNSSNTKKSILKLLGVWITLGPVAILIFVIPFLDFKESDNIVIAIMFGFLSIFSFIAIYKSTVKYFKRTLI